MHSGILQVAGIAPRLGLPVAMEKFPTLRWGYSHAISLMDIAITPTLFRSSRASEYSHAIYAQSSSAITTGPNDLPEATSFLITLQAYAIHCAYSCWSACKACSAGNSCSTCER